MPRTRREVLRGLTLGAGAVVLSPVLEQVTAHAAGLAPRKRFVFVVEGNGVPWAQVQPVGIARGREHERDRVVSLPLTDHALPPALEPLSPWKDRVTIVQGLSGRVCGGGHSNDFGALGCYPGKGGVPQGPTIDVALGQALGGTFPRVGLGISDRPEHTLIYNCSALGRDQPAPTQCRPDLAYAELFGSVAQGAAGQEFVAHRNMLDFLRDDLKRVEAALPASERARLAPHLAAYEALRERHSRLHELRDTLKTRAPALGDKFQSAVETDRLEAHFDLAAAALIGGLTRVVTIASGCGNPYFSVRFHGLGIALDKHSIGHGQSFEGRTWDQLSTAIRRFHFEQVAGLIRKLQTVPEGEGTMLDHTTIVYLSDSAESHHSRCWEWPFVLIGNAGGALKSGRYLEYPYWGRTGHKTLGNLYATLLHAAGKPRPFFGVKDPNLKDLDLDGPLAELLANEPRA